MSKTVILVGCRDEDDALNSMRYVSDRLDETHIKVIRRYYQYRRHVITTANCCIYFVTPLSILDGLRADAVFGEESFKPILWMYCKPDADREPTVKLVPYIRHVERICECIMYNPGISCKELVEGVRVMERIGKKKLIQEFADECDSLIKDPKIERNTIGGIIINGLSDNVRRISAEDVRKVFDKAKTDGVIADNKWELKLGDIDEWSKMPPYLGQQQIYLTTARGGGKNWYFEQWRKFMEQLDKESEIKPLSKKEDSMVKLPEIKNVIFNKPATIAQWADGTKTVVQCLEGDTYDPEKGLAMAISKKILGNKHDYYHTFKHWLKRYKKEEK